MAKLKNTNDIRNWWTSKGEDDQIWLMMKYGFSTPFDPKRVKTDEIVKIYNSEY